MQFFIVMVDYGRAREAVSNPEFTRRQIVEEVRDIVASHDRSVVFVKFVDGNFIEDVTAEICAEAGEPHAPLSPVNVQAARFDHKRALRNEYVA